MVLARRLRAISTAVEQAPGRTHHQQAQTSVSRAPLRNPADRHFGRNLDRALPAILPSRGP